MSSWLDRQLSRRFWPSTQPILHARLQKSGEVAPVYVVGESVDDAVDAAPSTLLMIEEPPKLEKVLIRLNDSA